MKRTITVVSSSRADYSHLHWPLRELASHPEIALKIVVMGPHLAADFGHSAREFERDGFTIDARIESLLSSDTDVGMAKSIGLATLGLADYLAASRPDLVLLTADRYEMLAPASVALALRIPLAHIEGGEVSEGAIDDAVRNALTKLSHVHFTSTAGARDRVIAMGEEPWRVHHVGAPSLDHVRRSPLPVRAELEAALSIDLGQPTIIVAHHPTTLAKDTLREVDAVFAALADTTGQLLFCHPNADAGSHGITERTQAFLRSRGNGKLFVNLPPATYWGLLGQVEAIVGNSSSGIMEAASFALPAVDIGMRQRGRERGRNVLSVEPEKDAILTALATARSESFRNSLRGMENPYGDGRSSERIAAVLAGVPLGERLLIKRGRPAGT
jgi:UDP-N-acetylglucosamine 2-epimerase (non-hydrolysing)/GDP/UDP-N,N'-diacetylbacillosamine 2-epimerase (hydrolysing)